MVDSEQRGEKANNSKSCKQICLSQLFAVIVFALGLAGGLCIGIFAYHGGTADDNKDAKCSTGSPLTATEAIPMPEASAKQCSTKDPVTGRSYADSIFAPLTASEMDKVAKFLLDNNVVSTLNKPTSLTENFILNQILDPPKKTEALEYLDNGGEKPKRYAKAIVQRGAVQPPDVMEYRVGPLDGSQMTVVSLTNPGEIDFNTRPYENVEADAIMTLLAPELEILAPLLSESFDGARFPEDTYINYYNGPPSTSGTERHVR